MAVSDSSEGGDVFAKNRRMATKEKIAQTKLSLLQFSKPPLWLRIWRGLAARALKPILQCVPVARVALRRQWYYASSGGGRAPALDTCQLGKI